MIVCVPAKNNFLLATNQCCKKKRVNIFTESIKQQRKSHLNVFNVLLNSTLITLIFGFLPASIFRSIKFFRSNTNFQLIPFHFPSSLLHFIFTLTITLKRIQLQSERNVSPATYLN